MSLCDGSSRQQQRTDVCNDGGMGEYFPQPQSADNFKWQTFLFNTLQTAMSARATGVLGKIKYAHSCCSIPRKLLAAAARIFSKRHVLCPESQPNRQA